MISSSVSRSRFIMRSTTRASKIHFRWSSKRSVDVGRDAAVSVLALHGSSRARSILLRVRMIFEALEKGTNIHVDEIVRDREIQAVNHGLFKKSPSWRNAYMDAGHKYHEQKCFQQQIYPHVCFRRINLRETVRGTTGCYAIASFRLQISVRAHLAVIPEPFAPAPIHVHDRGGHEREEDGVNYEHGRLGSSRRNASQNTGHERNEQCCSKKTTNEVHLLI